MHRLKITVSDIYQAYRLTKGIREAVRLTAQHVGRTAVQVCDFLGLDPRWSTGPTVDLDYTVTVWSKDKGCVQAAKDKLHSCLGDPYDVQYTPTRTHLLYKAVPTELP
jgi:hypothetical protein